MNRIHCGDNLEILSSLEEKSIDLIYADPPFFSNRHYEVIWNDGAEIRAFEDRWKGGIEHYISWMTPRLRECHRVLKDTGSMYLHCDWHANAHLRILMDKIFGENNFRNEIIWHYASGGASKDRFSRKHDNLLLYSKSSKSTHNILRTPYKTSNANDFIKRGLFHPDGKMMDDVWDISFLSTTASERLGYPTQKPEALLKRIIEASSNKGDIVLDPFCGCGTTIAVAQQLDRQWIGIDVSPTACRMISERLNKLGADIEPINMPATIEEVKAMKPYDFQAWVVNKIHGIPSNKKSGDMGIDGWTFMQHEPIQVKQSENVGRNVVDNFQSAIRRADTNTGYIYAFNFTRSAYEEVARLKEADNLFISLITIEDLLNGTE